MGLVASSTTEKTLHPRDWSQNSNDEVSFEQCLKCQLTQSRMCSHFMNAIVVCCGSCHRQRTQLRYVAGVPTLTVGFGSFADAPMFKRFLDYRLGNVLLF